VQTFYGPRAAAVTSVHLVEENNHGVVNEYTEAILLLSTVAGLRPRQRITRDNAH
jgi:hypothetical protein